MFATADIVPIALRSLWEKMKAHNMQSFIVNTVHDSAIIEVHPDERELLQELAVQSMTDEVYNYLYNMYGINFNVPLGIGIKFGKFWSEGDEIKIDKENSLGE